MKKLTAEEIQKFKDLLEQEGYSVGLKNRSKKSEYGIWKNMKDRCTNPENRNYKNYGGRGIKICDRWLNSFEAFLEDMKERPDPFYSLDRIDVNGNYEPGNCRWATSMQQGQNKRHIVRGHKLSVEDVYEIKKTIQAGGVKLKEIAKKYNVTPTTITNIKRGKLFKDICVPDPEYDRGFKTGYEEGLKAGLKVLNKK